MFPRIFLVLVVAASLLTGCRGETTQPTAPIPSAIPVERLNTDQMMLPRIDFCALVPRAVVDRALDTRAWELRDWQNGDQAPLVAGREDVVAEHLCQWTAKSGQSTARAWMFARPVNAKFARRVARTQLRSRSGPLDCRGQRTSHFGSPSLLQTCHGADVVRVRRAGLFHDTWLTCEVSDAAATSTTAVVRMRADNWCSEVTTNLSTTR